ncbi:MAG: hypothetical protein Q8K37_00630 [Alphaproteobacteria bacterium]|nr:hypothetical protein [Alphaproteobacteria bacterium]
MFAIYLHAICIIPPLFLAIFIFFRIKGDKIHKIMGWSFVTLMLISMIASFWIPSFGDLSFIHILSVATIYWIIRAIIAIRFKGPDWRYVHASNMISAFIGIFIAGIGVFVRHYIYPGDVGAGGIASLILAIILIPIAVKMSLRYKKSV